MRAAQPSTHAAQTFFMPMGEKMIGRLRPVPRTVPVRSIGFFGAQQPACWQRTDDFAVGRGRLHHRQLCGARRARLADGRTGLPADARLVSRWRVRLLGGVLERRVVEMQERVEALAARNVVVVRAPRGT